LRNMLLARMAALTSTVLSPEHGALIIDSLYSRHAAAMLRDHQRWSDEMGLPSPTEARAAIDDLIARRGSLVMDQLALRIGRRVRSLRLDVLPKEGGTILIDELQPPTLPSEVKAFKGASMHLRALPADGYEFAGWRNMEGTSSIRVDVAHNTKVTAVFRRTGTSGRNGLQKAGEERLPVDVP
jgi:hypothetical protein